MIEPTEENIALFILSVGFCPECGGDNRDERHVVDISNAYFLCHSCWLEHVGQNRISYESKVGIWKTIISKR